jgi:hypothetical protein
VGFSLRSSDQQTADPEATHQGVRDLIPIVAGSLLAAAMLFLLFHGRSTRFEDLALGLESTPVFAEFEGAPIHCRDLRDVGTCLEGVRRRGARDAALWLGNSQLHGVNQWQPGQETAPALLFRRLRDRGVDLVTLSQPNANFQEHLVLYAYLRGRLPLTTLLLPAVFDDTRETGVRASIATALEDAATRAVLERSEVGRGVLASNRTTADPDLAALEETLQERSEAWLNGWLDRHLELWRIRPQARGTLVSRLLDARNTAFGIQPDSKRRLIEGTYRQNLEAARAILADADERGIRALVYVVPLRDDVATPYVASEYARFKQDVERLAALHHAEFVNVEQAVPASMWGVTSAKDLSGKAAIDFMHFQAGGHAILADRLASALESPAKGSEQ